MQRPAIATIEFWIFDNNAVALETPTAAIKVTRPQEIAFYLAMFNQLQDQAIYGHDARQLVAKVLTSLGDMGSAEFRYSALRDLRERMMSAGAEVGEIKRFPPRGDGSPDPDDQSLPNPGSGQSRGRWT